jgi:hypothetical protein
MERKGQLLAMFLALIGVLIAYMLMDNSAHLAFSPNMQYAVYVVQDILFAALFYGLWKLNQSGKVMLVAYLSISIYILATALFAPADYLEYLMVAFALPIGVSSFVIRPSSSFFFASLTAVSCAFSSMYWGYAWEFNMIAFLSLFALAFMTWVISWKLENTIKENISLVANLQKSNAQIRDAYETTLEGWSHALDLRDNETEGHTHRVTELTVRLARALNVSEDDLTFIRWGSLLHDIGKLGVSDSILQKPDNLTEEETQTMQQHPRFAYGLMYPITYLRDALDIPCNHHEKWDGTGYPQGIAGEQIPLSARIFAIVDVYDALLYDRPHRKGWEKEKVMEHIREQSGKHFDPQIVEVFLKEIAKDENRNPSRK